MAAIDCCTREIVARHLQTRGRAKEAIALIEQAAAERAIAPATLTLGTDNARRSRPAHSRPSWPRSGSRSVAAATAIPESQAFIESWLGKLKERCVWRPEFETLDEAREVIGAYVIYYHQRPHSRLDYRTRLEVAATWNDGGLPHLTNPNGLTCQHGGGARQEPLRVRLLAPGSRCAQSPAVSMSIKVKILPMPTEPPTKKRGVSLWVQQQRLLECPWSVDSQARFLK
jgi:hypothetical protein